MELQLGLPWQQMDTKSGKKVAKGWCCALLGYHSKITLRASQGHCKVKLAKNIIFRIFYRFQTHLRCRWVLQMTAADTLLYWSHTISPRIARGLHAISALKGYYPLDISLITPLSQSWSESTKLLKCSSVLPQLEPPWQHKYGYRIGYERLHELVSPQGHLRVISRLLESQTDKTWFLVDLSIPNPFGVKVSFTNDCCWYIFCRIPFHHASQGICMPFQPWVGGGVIIPLVFPFPHPFPNVVVNQQNY